MTIFKTCDIRGLYGTEIVEDTGYRLGRAVGERLAGKEIVVGSDLRISTPLLKKALVDGLVASGGQVIDLGTLPTPAFYYGKRHFGAPGGVMVTASHNPATYNGFKVMLGESPVRPEELQALARQMAEGRYTDASGSCRREEILPDYQRFLSRSFWWLTSSRQLSALCLVVDAGNGSMWSLAPDVLRALGQRVHELYCTPDGTFPNRDPNPAVPEHLEDLRRVVLEEGADLGVAYDGDGDRVIFVDERGRIQPADRLLVLFIRYLLGRDPGAKVVYDLKSSSVVPEETRAAGGKPLRERSGYAFIRRRLLTEGALLGGELSGHYFFGALGGDDALYATLLLLRVLDALGVSLGEAMDTVPAYPITPDLRIPCDGDRARRILDELLVAFHDRPTDTLDGVRIDFAEGWALARISVTEPLITLRFEGRTFEALREIQRLVRGQSPLLQALLREHPSYLYQ